MKAGHDGGHVLDNSETALEKIISPIAHVVLYSLGGCQGAWVLPR